MTYDGVMRLNPKKHNKGDKFREVVGVGQ